MPDAPFPQVVPLPDALLVPLDLIQSSPDNVRRIGASAEADAGLATSIGKAGVLEPVLLREVEGGYQVVAGKRRVEGARTAGLMAVPAILVDDTLLPYVAQSAAENLARAPMDAVDTWRAMVALEAAGCTPAAAADALGLDPRRARRLALLGRMHPDVLGAMEGGQIPRDHELRTIASAPADMQVAAFAKASRSRDGHVEWWNVARGCSRTTVPRGRAVFDVAASGILFEEDLFAQPGSDEQWTTSDVAGFLAAQGAALDAWVEAERAAGRRAARGIVKVDDYQVFLPKGFVRDHASLPKDCVLAKLRGFKRTGNKTLFLGLRTEGYSVGEVMSAVGIEVAVQPEPDEDGPAPGAAGRPAVAVQPAPKLPYTQRGLELVVQAKNRALLETLTTPATRPATIDLLRMLVLALDAPNVTIQGNPQALSPVAHKRFADLAARLADPDGRYTLAEVEAAAAEALARIVRVSAGDAYWQGSGDKAEIIGRILGAEAALPRFDTEEFLAAVTGDELRRLADGAGLKAPTVAGLRKLLVGRLPDWRPAAFTPAPPKQAVDGRGDPPDDDADQDEEEASGRAAYNLADGASHEAELAREAAE